ncbi:predicted protein [Plenodomus lingam JN3]|uniref:Predicted protein n=1 Tax=Leptosphaeria maculans (strain JN3 / isolate v23.1.3 / race Av1-4-5-6-7-8) TaxID=985895 RepID=E4ZPU7_LEPMJ|nr:predicted protein [Plenodomus lingam JN3]CBX93482.1 predicted protein [Plenodomus lingam JN3]
MPPSPMSSEFPAQAFPRPAQLEAFLEREDPDGPDRAKSIWSQKNVDTISRLIKDGRIRPAGLAVVEAAKVDWRWDRAYAGPGMITVPKDLTIALAEMPPAKASWDHLNKSERISPLTEGVLADTICYFDAQTGQHTTWIMTVPYGFGHETRSTRYMRAYAVDVNLCGCSALLRFKEQWLTSSKISRGGGGGGRDREPKESGQQDMYHVESDGRSLSHRRNKFRKTRLDVMRWYYVCQSFYGRNMVYPTGAGLAAGDAEWGNGSSTVIDREHGKRIHESIVPCTSCTHVTSTWALSGGAAQVIGKSVWRHVHIGPPEAWKNIEKEGKVWSRDTANSTTHWYYTWLDDARKLRRAALVWRWPMICSR